MPAYGNNAVRRRAEPVSLRPRPVAPMHCVDFEAPNRRHVPDSLTLDYSITYCNMIRLISTICVKIPPSFNVNGNVQNLRKTQQKRGSSRLVKDDFFYCFEGQNSTLQDGQDFKSSTACSLGHCQAVPRSLGVLVRVCGRQGPPKQSKAQCLTPPPPLPSTAIYTGALCHCSCPCSSHLTRNCGCRRNSFSNPSPAIYPRIDLQNTAGGWKRHARHRPSRRGCSIPLLMGVFSNRCGNLELPTEQKSQLRDLVLRLCSLHEMAAVTSLGNCSGCGRVLDLAQGRRSVPPLRLRRRARSGRPK